MKETLDRIQNWYILNCNGDWEHNHGYSIATLDNPGWTIRIDLRETALHGLEYVKNFQNPNFEHDWYQIKTSKQVLEIFCGPENLKQALGLFLDEIIPNYVDKEFEYDIYLPLIGHTIEIWTPAKAVLVNEETVRITKIAPVDTKDVKVHDYTLIDFNQNDLEKLQLHTSIGDLVGFSIQDVFDGLILTMIRNE